MQAELLTCVYTHMQTSIHTGTDVCFMQIAICHSVHVDIQRHICIIAQLDYSSGSSIGSWGGSIHSWGEAVEPWPTASSNNSSSGSYAPTWHVDDFTSTHGVCAHGGQAFMVYDYSVQAIVAYGQPLFAQS